MFKIVLSTLASLTSLFILTKLIGNRQMSQLSMFDYISSIAIGSIAGEMAVMSTDSIIEPLISMIIFSLFSIAVSYMTCKSICLRRFFEGKAIILYYNGQIYEKNLLRVKLDIDELLSACRLNGYFDLEEVNTVYLETNGQISVLPKSKDRPASPKDLKIHVKEKYPLPNVIIDGNIMNDNLKCTGKSIGWVENQLTNNSIKNINEIILATYDKSEDKLNIYMKYNKKMLCDIFE